MDTHSLSLKIFGLRSIYLNSCECTFDLKQEEEIMLINHYQHE